MEIRIEPPVLELFPELRVGVVVARGLDNRSGAGDGSSAAASAAAVAPTAAAVLSPLQRASRSQPGGFSPGLGGAAAGNCQDPLAQAISAVAALPIDDVPNHPAIAPWRAAYRAFGVKPNDHRPSLEGLLRAARRGTLGSINPLVDLYNAVSLTWLLPCGGEDLATIEGNLRLTRAEGGEAFVPLGGGPELPPKPGEVIYRDDGGVVCRCLNWREADRTKLTPATRDAVLVLEALPGTGVASEGADQLVAAVDDLAARIGQILGGTTTVVILDRHHPEAPLGG